VHPHQSFLPELDAYARFFSAYGIQCFMLKPEMVATTSADLFWHFMGNDKSTAKKGAVTIHEYASASAPPFRKIKDMVKVFSIPKPGYRLFLNEYVGTQLAFNDGVPFGYRDMGVFPASPARMDNKKEYDFIYVGGVDRERNMNLLLDQFTRPGLKDHRLLILSKDYESLALSYSRFPNIIFKGPVKHDEVSAIIVQASFAINHIPDKAPFNEQTSTKFLEYASLQVPVISTDYAWIRRFQEKYGGKYYYLSNDYANFTWENVSGFDYSFPDLKEWTWEKQIRKSGVLEFIERSFPEIHFSI
jgi:glycosyltransferase involved in cell wall biosynthesis